MCTVQAVFCMLSIDVAAGPRCRIWMQSYRTAASGAGIRGRDQAAGPRCRQRFQGCDFSASPALSSGRTTRSMVMKQASPPTTLEMGSAAKTPFTPMWKA